MKENVIKTKSFGFALKIVEIVRTLDSEWREYVLSKQLMRSGTSIGALVREAEQAESKSDFIHKMAIAQKEANEAEYWIELLFHSNYLDGTQYNSMQADCNELKKIVASIIITAKRNRLKAQLAQKAVYILTILGVIKLLEVVIA